MTERTLTGRRLMEGGWDSLDAFRDSFQERARAVARGRMDMNQALQPGLSRQQRIDAEVARRRQIMMEQARDDKRPRQQRQTQGGVVAASSSSSSRRRPPKQTKKQQNEHHQHHQHGSTGYTMGKQSGGGGGGGGAAPKDNARPGLSGDGQQQRPPQYPPSMGAAEAEEKEEEGEAMDDFLQSYLKRHGHRNYVDPRAETRNKGFRALESQQYGLRKTNLNLFGDMGIRLG